MKLFIITLTNQFQANVPFPYFLKTSKNLFFMFSWGIEMEYGFEMG